MNSIFRFLFFLFLSLIQVGCSQGVPEKWQNIGVPTKGLIKIYDHSNQDGFYADYTEITAKELSKHITDKLLKLGYSEVCSEFDGNVKGYQRKEKKLIVKVDKLGHKVGLSIFNENGEEPLLYGLCFKGYNLVSPKPLE